jgi:hypothetical protein
VKTPCADTKYRGKIHLKYRADSPQLAPIVKEQITNTGAIPSVVSADDGYCSQEGLPGR